ncbi:MAG: FluC/FEX family fluoride channel, partial [Cyanobacteriota bacterium]|jgi:CrcB protein
MDRTPPPRFGERLLPDLLLLALGAVPGALLRWQLENTLVANLLGCLVLGAILARQPGAPRLMLLGGLGFCGSLTTFSTWILELDQALKAGQPGPAALQLLPALVGGVGGVLVGMGLGSAWIRRAEARKPRKPRKPGKPGNPFRR